MSGAGFWTCDAVETVVTLDADETIAAVDGWLASSVEVNIVTGAISSAISIGIQE